MGDVVELRPATDGLDDQIFNAVREVETLPPKRPPEFAPNTDDPDGARTVGNLVIDARKFFGLAA
jgi:hypothetical protein